MSLSTLALALGGLASVVSSANVSTSSIWVDSVPTYVRPYAIPHNAPQGIVVGAQIYRFPVNGNSSGGAFTIIQTNAPNSDALGVLPHTHRTHYENFFCYKGSYQLWTSKENETESRILGPGDYGSVPINTTHTFQLLSPDTELTGVIVPGGFEALFYALSSGPFNTSTYAPYALGPQDAANASASTSSGVADGLISELQALDVYAQLDFNTTLPLVDGSSNANASWHKAASVIPEDDSTPYYVAKDWGPKYLVTNHSTFYQVVQPLNSPVNSGEYNFTLATISMQRKLQNQTDERHTLQGHCAFLVLEGALSLTMLNETVTLFDGDVAFVPADTQFSYSSPAGFSKVYYISQGQHGLDQQFISAGNLTDYPVWPAYAA